MNPYKSASLIRHFLLLLSFVLNYKIEIQSDNTIKLTIKTGIQKPYLYKSKAYKRNDTATIEVDTFEFPRLILKGKNVSQPTHLLRQSHFFTSGDIEL